MLTELYFQLEFGPFIDNMPDQELEALNNVLYCTNQLDMKDISKNITFMNLHNIQINYINGYHRFTHIMHDQIDNMPPYPNIDAWKNNWYRLGFDKGNNYE